MNTTRHAIVFALLFLFACNVSALETYNFLDCGTGEVVELDAFWLDWQWSSIRVEHHETGWEDSTCYEYYCDATQIMISIFERMHEFSEDSSKQYLLDFNAYLVEDGFSDDFKRDFLEATDKMLFDAPEWFVHGSTPLKEYLPDNIEFNETGLNGPGKYNVKVNGVTGELFNESNEPKNEIIIEFTKLEEAIQSHPLLYIPLDGVLGIDGTREGYGSIITKEKEIKISSKVPEIKMYYTKKDCNPKALIEVRNEEIKGRGVLDLRKSKEGFKISFKERELESLKYFFEPNYYSCVRQVNQSVLLLEKMYRPVFVVSSLDWRSVLKAVPIAVHNKSPLLVLYSELVDGVKHYPVNLDEFPEELITGTVVNDSLPLKYFLEDYHPSHIKLFELYDIKAIDDLNDFEELIELSSTARIDFEWNDVKRAVIVGYSKENYKEALMASTYASLIEAPLFFINEENLIQHEKLFENLRKEKIIKKDLELAVIIGEMDGETKEFLRKNFNEIKEYSLLEIQKKYVKETGTDKIILVNANDYKEEYCNELFIDEEGTVIEYDYGYNGINYMYCNNSLTSPILAAERKEIIVFTETEPSPTTNINQFNAKKVNEIGKKIKKEFKEKTQEIYQETNITPKYLTVIGSIKAIPLAEFNEEKTESIEINEWLDRKLAETLHEGPKSMNTGRITGGTTSDTSTKINRSTQYNQLKMYKNNPSILFAEAVELPISSDAGPSTYVTSYMPGISSSAVKAENKVTYYVPSAAELHLTSFLGETRREEGTFEEAGEKAGKFELVNFECHGTPPSIQFIFEESEEETKKISKLNSTIAVSPSCNTLDYYYFRKIKDDDNKETEPVPLIGLEWIRQGGAAYIGPISWSWKRAGLTMNSSYTEDILLKLFRGLTLGEALKEVYLEDPNESTPEPFKDSKKPRVYALFGDPLLKPKINGFEGISIINSEDIWLKGIFLINVEEGRVELKGTVIDDILTSLEIYFKYEEEKEPYSVKAYYISDEGARETPINVDIGRIEDIMHYPETKINEWTSIKVRAATIEFKEFAKDENEVIAIVLEDKEGVKATYFHLHPTQESQAWKKTRAYYSHSNPDLVAAALDVYNSYILVYSEEGTYAAPLLNKARLMKIKCLVKLNRVDEALNELDLIPVEAKQYNEAIQALLEAIYAPQYFTKNNWIDLKQRLTELTEKITAPELKKEKTMELNELIALFERNEDTATIYYFLAKNTELDSEKNIGEAIDYYTAFLNSAKEDNPWKEDALLLEIKALYELARNYPDLELENAGWALAYIHRFQEEYPESEYKAIIDYYEGVTEFIWSASEPERYMHKWFKEGIKNIDLVLNDASSSKELKKKALTEKIHRCNEVLELIESMKEINISGEEETFVENEFIKATDIYATLFLEDNNPESCNIEMRAASRLFELEKYRKSISYCNAVIEKCPGKEYEEYPLEALILLGRTYRELGVNDKALEKLEEARKEYEAIKPSIRKDIVYYYFLELEHSLLTNLISLYVNENDGKNAVKAFKELLSVSEYFTEWHELMDALGIGSTLRLGEMCEEEKELMFAVRVYSDLFKAMENKDKFKSIPEVDKLKVRYRECNALEKAIDKKDESQLYQMYVCTGTFSVIPGYVVEGIYKEEEPELYEMIMEMLEMRQKYR